MQRAESCGVHLAGEYWVFMFKSVIGRAVSYAYLFLLVEYS